jgi:hypothetical protein
MVQKYLMPAVVKAGVIKVGENVRFGFYNFQNALATTNRFEMWWPRTELNRRRQPSQGQN